MSDPIGAAVARAYAGNEASVRFDIQDTRVREVPVLDPDSGGVSFADTLTRLVNGVSEQQNSAASTVQAYLRGDDVELHRVMAVAEEAQLSLEMLVEIRNKFAEAYRTLTTMQG